jgi:glucose-6-phosphate dehydrogenase assembly protein OpcA
VITELADTDAAAVSSALTRARHAMGGPAVGVVMTLVVLAEERTVHDAMRAASEASRAHPSRMIVLVNRGGRGDGRLDAEVRVGNESATGEIVIMRTHGALSKHSESVIVPLLLPDTPVVAWWPGAAPLQPKLDPVGALATRRITDAAAVPKPLEVLATRSQFYSPGDTDLAWTRCTPWRTLLAATFDQSHDTPHDISVSAQRGNPSAELLARWLEVRLGVEVERHTSRGPGVTSVSIGQRNGTITIDRPDGRVAVLRKPGQPDRAVALIRRELPDLLAEELRRLDADEVYEETLQHGAEVPA